jgi:biotin carboxyl carrier protein
MVSPGDELLVLEAMKMKNIINAEETGKVKKVLVSVGDSVSHNQPLIELEQAET